MDKYPCRVSSNPTFSSTLLDAIYRSIDEGEVEPVVYSETMRKKQHSRVELKNEEEMANFQRLQMIEKWMEKDSEKPKTRNRDNLKDFYSNSSRSSSDSNSGGRFSSSEAEDYVFAGPIKRSPSSSCYIFQKPKPIKNNIVSVEPKHEEGFEKKTKSRALQIYLDMKKAKKTTSPSGKFASFLNSVFSTVHEKREKTAAQKDIKSKSSNSSTSSFSRSCLSRTQSSRKKFSSNETKRSVTFCPVSEIIDEDYSQPCGHKTLHEDKARLEEGKDIKNQTDPSLSLRGGVHYINTTFQNVKDVRTIVNEELKIYDFEKKQQVGEGAKNLLRNYQKMVDLEIDLKVSNFDKNQVFIDEDEEDFDAVSCCSSDLFELDNLSAIGMEM